jgi:flagellar FliJ protein
MKKFKFSLQRLLEIREAAEKEIKNELAAIMALQNAERARQDELRTNIDLHRKNFRERMKEGKYRITEGIYLEKFLDISHRAIVAAERKIEEIEPEVQEVRDRLVEASRERKVVEKLRERKLEEYNYHVNSELAKENDDINQKIYLRRKLGLQ